MVVFFIIYGHIYTSFSSGEAGIYLQSRSPPIVDWVTCPAFQLHAGLHSVNPPDSLCVSIFDLCGYNFKKISPTFKDFDCADTWKSWICALLNIVIVYDENMMNFE